MPKSDALKIAELNARQQNLRLLLDNPLLQFAALYYVTEYMVDKGISGWKWDAHTGEALMIAAGGISVAKAIAPALPSMASAAGDLLKLIPGV